MKAAVASTIIHLNIDEPERFFIKKIVQAFFTQFEFSLYFRIAPRRSKN